MSLGRNILTVGGFTLLSRITGFVRDILIAALLGAGPVADAFFVAFKFPNFFRRLSGEGALTAAFVPLFSEKLEQEGREAARFFAGRVVSVALVILLGFLVVMEIIMPWAMHVLAPGFVDNPEQFDLTVDLTRITFGYLPLISLMALLGGVMNTLDRFAAMAAAPILLNVILVVTLITVFLQEITPGSPTVGYWLAWAVAGAGAAQFFWLVGACHRAGFDIPLPRPRLTPGIVKLFKLMGPAAIGAGVMQINLVIDVVLASLLAEGSVAFLYYADRVNQLPLGVIGVAAGTALLPLLSRQAAKGDDAGAAHSLNRGIELVFLLTLPAAVGLIVLSDLVVTVLFERGAFTPEDTLATAGALAAYALGLPAFALVKVFTPAFFARQDTKTPVKIAAVMVVINLIANLILMQYFAHVGLALATALSSTLNALALAVVLYRRGLMRPDARLWRRMGATVLASALMAAAVLGIVAVLPRVLLVDGFGPLVGLAVAIGGGVLVFALAAMATGAARPAEVKDLLKGRA
ncbi:MAG: murein biosynthesis integral membrane protein MurJ [Alphaproteobacteria bacterium]|nr:murein biosynthesis integral membrane protein MurJ [Alphaproteobacteria bacterium]